MRRLWTTSVLALLAIGSAAPADDPNAVAEAGVRAAAQAYVQAFNSHDAAAVGQLWSEHAVYADRVTGEQTEGRAAIQAEIAEIFTTHPDIRLQFDAGTVRFVRPDVAQAQATATVVIPDEEPSVVSVTALYVKQGEAWLLDSVEEMNVPAPESAGAALQELEWLIGEWHDESDAVEATSSFRWGADGAFLIRAFKHAAADAATQEGTQVIGWDPRAGHIRSWTFNSDGSFGEATWSRNGDAWMIKSTQTLADGGSAAGTYVITPVDANSMTVQLIGHEINGEPQPTGDAVRVVRAATEQAAAPADAAAANAPAASTGGKP